LSRIYKILQFLSIDVALGSVASSILAVKVSGARLPVAYWFILPLCVWIIYTADHLLDALKTKENSTMERHFFHYIHRKTFMFFLVLTCLLSILLIINYLGRTAIFFGVIIVSFIIIYLFLNRFRCQLFTFFPKEIVIALGYMAGTWGIPLLLRYSFLNRTDLFIFVTHFLVILSIPLLYSIYEVDADKTAGFVSFATTFGVKTAEIAVSTLLVISSIFSIVVLFTVHYMSGFILMAMSGSLFVVLLFQNKLGVKDYYRTISDSITFLPFLLLVKL